MYDTTSVTSPNGWTCSNCGAFVPNGCTHNCGGTFINPAIYQPIEDWPQLLKLLERIAIALEDMMYRARGG